MDARDLLKCYTQPPDCVSGGVHTPPEFRLLLFALGVGLRAKDILETGYDAGYTTEALAHTGANVVGLDNLAEYPGVEGQAQQRLAQYPNVKLVQINAIDYLRKAEDESFDLIFIDDMHNEAHVRLEAVEVRRVLRPSGIVLFHDTLACGLWAVVADVFTDWHLVNLPCYSPEAGSDFGAALVRKPKRGEHEFEARAGRVSGAEQLPTAQTGLDHGDGARCAAGAVRDG